MSEVQNLRAFKVTFLSPTNHRGARVKIVDVMTKSHKDANATWGKMRHTIVLSYDYAIGAPLSQAIEHMVSVGLSVVAHAQVGDGEHVILSDSWSAEFRDLDGVTFDEHEQN